MAKLTEMTNPVSGQSGSVTNVRTWKNYIVGALFLMAVMALAKTIMGVILRFLPGRARQALTFGQVPQPAAPADPYGGYEIWK